MSSSGINAGAAGGRALRSQSGSAPMALSGNLTSPVLLTSFIVCLMLPLYFSLGDLRLTPTRIFLLLTFVPLVIRLLSGQAGPVRSVDVCFMLFMTWLVIVMVYHHGISRLPLSGATISEMFGGYMVGRVLVRNEADFRFFFRVFLIALILLFPFVLLEHLTDRNLVQEISRKIGPTFFKGDSSRGRLGLYRVMAGFEHPILYGLFCSLGFAPVFFIYREKAFKALAALGFVGFMTFASLSSAPLLSVAIQSGLILWGRMTGARWWPLIILISITYVTVDMLSNRTPITILINYVTFDPNTAWTRVNIWNFGSAEVLRHPIMGIGLNDWQRPDWMASSVDNFWLLTTMRYGLPGFGLLVAGILLLVVSLVKAKNLTPHLANYRTGYLISLACLCFSLGTVHVWGNSSAFMMMFLGIAVWLGNAGSANPQGGETAEIPPRRGDRIDPSGSGRTPEPVAVKEPVEDTAGRGAFSRFPQVHRRKDPPGQTD